MLVPNTQASTNGSLTITVNGLKNQKGQVCFSIFSSKQGFPHDSKRALKSQCVQVEDTPVKLTFDNLQAGNYSIAVFHDANEDGNLNRNFFGIPTEGFGFSNNPRIFTGPPKFNESAILVAGTITDIQIDLQYLL